MPLHVVVIGSVGLGLRICSLVDCLCSGCLIVFLLMMLRFVTLCLWVCGYLLLGWLGLCFSCGWLMCCLGWVL